MLFNWLGVAAVGTGCGGIGCPVIVACLLDLGLPAPAGQGVRSNTTTETFDDLRLENYSSARAGIDALPPTSSVIRGHIQRGAFLVHRACHLFETAKEPMARLGPMEHGWEEHFGTLLPSKGLKPLPQYVSVSASVRLDDVAAGVPCITFCHRKVDNPSCKSPSH